MKLVFTALLLAALCCNVVFAQSAERVAAASGTVFVTSATITANTSYTCGAWTSILGTSIKPPGGKDLLIGFSAQTGLFTDGSQNSFFNLSTTSTMENTGIQVRVLVDSASTAEPAPLGTQATPAVNLTFDNLIRTTTFFSGATGGHDILTLVVNEGGARSFNFFMQDVGVGLHTVNVQSRFCYGNTGSGGTAPSSNLSAVIGPRTLTVEEVKLDAQ